MTSPAIAHRVESEEDQAVELPDGRSVALRGYGPADGFPVLFCHGSPDSRLSARVLEPAANEARVRILALDRPGIGRSDPSPRRQIMDWPEDVAFVLDALGMARVGLLGVSAGAAYVYACCHAWPERVTGAAVVSGVGPPDLLTGFRPMTVRAMLRIPRLGRAMFGTVESRARRDPDRYVVPGAQPADIRALELPSAREPWIAGLLEAYRQGADGVVVDQSLQLKPWGFSLASITTPIQIWHGEADGVVPIAVARKVTAALPAGRLAELPGEGHLSALLNHTGEILGRFTIR